MVYEGKDLTAYYCESPHSKADLKETIEQLKALIDRHGEEKIEKGVYIGNRPYDSYGYGTGSYGNRPYDSYGYGTGSYGNRPHNSYGYGTSSYGNWPYDNYGHGTGSYGNRPYDSYGHGTGSYGNRPYYREGYRRRYNGYRPYGNRPYGGGNRPYGNRPYGGGNRPYGNGGYGGGSSSSEGGFSSRRQDWGTGLNTFWLRWNSAISWKMLSNSLSCMRIVKSNFTEICSYEFN